jgi:hypothetical protein
MVSLVYHMPSMLELLNYNSQQLRRTTQTALVCLAILFILDGWLVYQLIEGSYGESKPGTPDQWHAFWLPVLTNLVSTVLCVLGAFWLFFRSNPVADGESEEDNLKIELKAIKDELSSMRQAQALQQEQKFTMADVERLLDHQHQSASAKDKTHSNMVKGLTNVLITANNNSNNETSTTKLKTKR